MHFSRIYIMLGMAASAVSGLVPQVPRNIIDTGTSKDMLRRAQDISVVGGSKRGGGSHGDLGVIDGFRRDTVEPLEVSDGFKA